MRKSVLPILVLLAFSFGFMPFAWAAADSISVAVPYEIYALGETIAVTVEYFGATHGDVKLSATNSKGANYGEWSWSHLGGETYAQAVTIKPTQAGGLTLEATHVPHHGEPAAKASKLISVWSARIVAFDVPGQANSTAPVRAQVTVLYSFTQSTKAQIEVWERTGNAKLGQVIVSLSGEGTKTYEIEFSAPASEQIWNLEARVHYEILNRGMLHDQSDWSASAKLQVIPEFSSLAGTASAMVLLLAMPLLLVLRQRRAQNE